MKLKCIEAHPSYWRYFKKGQIHEAVNNQINGWGLSEDGLTVNLDTEYASSPVVAKFVEADQWDLHEYEQKMSKSIAW